MKRKADGTGGGKRGVKVRAIVFAAAAVLGVAALAALTVTRHGLVTVGTGFMVRARAVLAALEPVPYDPEARREAGDADLSFVASAPRGSVDVRDLAIDGPGGKLPLRLYRSEGAPSGPVPVLLFMHGGGWVQGR